MSQTPKDREHWGSSWGFILAAVGSAVGLGNIWKFPYITGENGGGAFVLVYLLCIAVVGAPVLICEFALGRHTQRNPVGAFKALTPKNSVLAHLIGLGMLLAGLFLLLFQSWGWGTILVIFGILIFKYSWVLVGAMGVIAGFTILSFYSVVAGWTLGYVWKAATLKLTFTNEVMAKAYFDTFTGDWRWAVGLHFLFMLLCVLIVYRGIKSGIERWSKILMPMLFFIILALIIRSMTLPGAMAGVHFFLTPDFSKINTNSVLLALGHAFFTLSLGMGAMITYGSYMKKEQNLFTSMLAVVGLDTLIALMAGLAIFPAVFALGFAPDGGPGLVFKVLPTVFNQIPFGAFWAFLFFLLLSIAALTSGISLLEVVTAYFVDEKGWTRKWASVIFGGIIFLLGCLCAISVDDWKRVEWLHSLLLKIFGHTGPSFFAVMEDVSSNWLLPLGGMLISIFVGWIWGTKRAIDEIRQGSANFADVHLISLLAGLKDDPSHSSGVHPLTLASIWGIFIRFISPVAVMIAFLHTIGWLNLHPEKAPLPPPPPPIEQTQ